MKQTKLELLIHDILDHIEPKYKDMIEEKIRETFNSINNQNKKRFIKKTMEDEDD